jgi:hypothetical protein
MRARTEIPSMMTRVSANPFRSAIGGLALALLASPLSMAHPGNVAHLNFHLIGLDTPKTADVIGSNAHLNSVPPQGSTKIGSSAGDVAALDANGTDSHGAEFPSPNPHVSTTASSTCPVIKRAAGTPNGIATLTIGLVDSIGATFYSTAVFLLPTTGKQSFENAGKEVLTVSAHTDGEGIPDKLASHLSDLGPRYFCWYDNSGLRLAQIRLHDVPSNVGTIPIPAKRGV